MSSNRRNFLKTAAAAGGAAASASALAKASAARGPSGTAATKDNRPPFRLIWEGEWNDVPCSDYPLTPEKWAQESITPIVNTDVDALVYNLCSSDGYVAELENGERLLANVKQFDDSWIWRYRENTKRLIEAGANPPDLAVKYGRRYGLKILPAIRMNDAHDQYFLPEVSDFKLKNPQYLLGNPHWGKKEQKEYPLDKMECFTWGMFDFSHKAVRDHKLAIINEFATRWDNDGVMLDFDRDPMFFWPPQGGGGKPENREKMTDLIRSVRATLDKVETERGKKQFLMVRLIPSIEVCLERGLDVATWVKEGLVQVIIPGSGFAPLTLDPKPWLELVEGKECWIYPGNWHWRPTRETRAWAAQMLDQGAHGLYLFNWGHLLMGYRPGDRPPPPILGRTEWRNQGGSVWRSELDPDYYTTLSEIGDIRKVQFKAKTYLLDSHPHELIERHGRTRGKLFREYRAIDDVVLPITLSVGRHEVPFRIGDDLAAAQQAAFDPRARLKMVIVNTTHPDRFSVTLNDTPLDDATRTTRDVYIMNNFTRVEYPLPVEALERGKNRLRIEMHETNPQMRVDPVLDSVEIVIDYA